jgi:hypothetical protein
LWSFGIFTPVFVFFKKKSGNPAPEPGSYNENSILELAKYDQSLQVCVSGKKCDNN